MDAPLGRVTRHRAEIAMHHRLAADKEQVTDMILHRDVDDIPRFLQGDAVPRFGIELRTRKTAEVAIGIADVGDGELQIAGPAVIEDFLEQLPGALPWT